MELSNSISLRLISTNSMFGKYVIICVLNAIGVKVAWTRSFLRMQARRTHRRCSSSWMSYPNARPKNQFLCFVRRVPSHGNDAEALLHARLRLRKACRSVSRGGRRQRGRQTGRRGVGWGVLKQESDEAIFNKWWQSCRNCVEIKQSVTTKCYE